MIVSIIACLGALGVLLRLLRRDRLSMGLPLAYMVSLLLIHVPGALAHVLGADRLPGTEYVATGIAFTAIGAACFTGGVWLARRRVAVLRIPRQPAPEHPRFASFCLFGGWIAVFGLSTLTRVPSIGALVNSGGDIWMLGALLGLRGAIASRQPERIMIWVAALAVYPAMSLLLAGFLSYGVAAVTIVGAVLIISARSYLRSAFTLALVAVAGVTIFVNYYEHREDIRENVWGQASMNDRLDSVSRVVENFHLIDLDRTSDLISLDQRLNQNMFVGIAASRLADGEVEFLRGRSVYNGFLSLIPRAVWADKPVTGGSGDIVVQMTGLHLNEDTSWGVGNVLEFYINFGMPGLIVGFLGLGWLIGLLDLRAALADRRGDRHALLLYFLPAVTLIQPGASLVEITGSTAAAYLASLGWRWLWTLWTGERTAPRRTGLIPRPPVATERSS